MARTKSKVRVRDLPTIVAEHPEGAVSLVGDHGGLSRISGEIHPSSVVRDTIRVETEHGSIYLATYLEIEISVERRDELAEDDRRDVDWLIEWNITHTAGLSTPREAAEAVWRDVFGRTRAGMEDACVFFVTDPSTGEQLEVDLSSVPMSAD